MDKMVEGGAGDAIVVGVVVAVVAGGVEVAHTHVEGTQGRGRGGRVGVNP